MIYFPTDQVVVEDENIMVNETECNNCRAAYFCESKRSLKLRSDEHKRSLWNCDCDKNEIVKKSSQRTLADCTPIYIVTELEKLQKKGFYGKIQLQRLSTIHFVMTKKMVG